MLDNILFPTNERRLGALRAVDLAMRTLPLEHPDSLLRVETVALMLDAVREIHLGESRLEYEEETGDA